MEKGTKVTRKSDNLEYEYLGGDEKSPSSYRLVSDTIKAPVAPAETTAVAPPVTGPEKPSYLSQLGGFFTEDIPAAGKSIASKWGRIGQPTVLEQPSQLGAPGLRHPVKEPTTMERTMAGLPERTLRGLGFQAGTLNELIGLGMSGVNRLAGGLLGKAYQGYLEGPAGKGIQSLGGMMAQTAPGKGVYELGSQASPEFKADLGSAVDVATGFPAAPKGAGKLLEGLGRVTESVGTKMGVEKAAKQMLTTADAATVSQVSKSPIPKTQAKNLSNIIKKYNLQGTLSDPNNSMQQKALEMAMARSKKGQEDLIKASTGFEGKISNPISAVDDKMIQFINTEIRVSDRSRALKAYEKLKQELTNAGYNQDVHVADLANMKNDLMVNWNKGSAIDPKEALKNQIDKKMYHQLNDVIKDRVPSAYKANQEASELFTVADIAKDAIKPAVSKVPATLAGAGGLLLGGGPIAEKVISGLVNNAPSGVRMTDAIAPAIAAYLAAKGVQQATKPSTLSQLVSAGRGMQDVGQRLQMSGPRGVLGKPELRPGTTAFENTLKVSNTYAKDQMEYLNNLRLLKAAQNAGDIQKVRIFQAEVDRLINKIASDVLKKEKK
jgi:hypothetical protein